MKKKSNKKLKFNSLSNINSNIHELNDSRNGGQIALKGYSYQLLYSCYLILSNKNPDVSFHLEGIEDIDYIDKKENEMITHIQLKYSDNKWDASSLVDVLKNFLEAYLLDTNRYFKLVYDFSVAKGNLSKIISSNLDAKSREYWQNIIIKIKKDNPHWNWTLYNFDSFMNHISYENITKISLEEKIEQSLIVAFDINTDNFSLFINSLKVLCFEKMEHRESITSEELENCIQSVKFDISKGNRNPAHSWISRIDYNVSGGDNSKGFYEGKKATIKDIINGLPVKRPKLENEIVESIENNIVTVIKASSGQGKTTLALQVAYNVREEYIPYQLTCCNDVHELGNIVQYFRIRIRLGEKLLILIDNLDSRVKNWNELVQLMQNELPCNFSLLITTREIDWYNYCGDTSNIQSLNIIKPVLDEREAEDIYMLFKSVDKIHDGVDGWEKAWNRIAERKLLIEYVFLLTHGEMLSERISAQISEINRTEFGAAKCEILRKVCFADVCGVKLTVSNLYNNQIESCRMDFGELLKSMESEFLVHVDEEDGYIEGLHPVRSMHIVKRLHEFIAIDSTAMSVISMTLSKDYSMLFSHLTEFQFKKEIFFHDVVELIFNQKEMSCCYYAIQGLFWGNVMQYYIANESVFNDAAMHNGLELITMEMCPFTIFDEFGVEVKTFDKLKEIQPQDKNIEYLCQLRKKFLQYDLRDSYLYVFCNHLYNKMLEIDFKDECDIESYSIISEWMYTLDTKFNLSDKYPLKNIWDMEDKLTIECISSLMYILFCGNKVIYDKFVSNNIEMIMRCLKRKTKSHKIYVDKEKNAIHVEYIYKPIEMNSLNDESVNRLKYICKTLPIFNLYCSDVIKPDISMLSAYKIPDEAHKEMPIRNLVIMFHQNIASLWCKTIMSNYEFDTVAEWLGYWLNIRKHICKMTENYCECIYRIMGGKPLGKLAVEVDECAKEYMVQMTSEKRYPKQERPFEEKLTMPDGLNQVKNQYFQSIKNFVNQFVGFLNRDEKYQRLVIANLTMAKSSLKLMQQYFGGIIKDIDIKRIHSDICIAEEYNLNQLMMCCCYYLGHVSNKYFNKNDVKKWYESEEIKKKKKVEKGLEKLAEEYVIYFPIKTYTVGVLKYYPIIVDNLNINSAEIMERWLIACVPFAESAFDYLIILLSDKSGSVAEKAIQIPKQTLIDVKQYIESGNENIDISPVYPVEVKQQMLDCFEESYNIIIKDTEDVSCIADIVDGLWRYSKTIELLGIEDNEYLSDELQQIYNEIDKKLNMLKQKISSDDINQLCMLCQNVYNGCEFNDDNYNEIIGKIYRESLE